MITNERRTANRVNLRIPVRFRTLASPAGGEQSAESVNISPRGVYFATPFPLKVGAPLELFLRMPSELTGQAGTELRCTARVVHIQPDTFLGGKAGVGVRIERYEAMANVERWAS